MEALMDFATNAGQSVGSDGLAPSVASSVQNPQKRNRRQLSCTNCRTTKVKCDRKQPCSQCAKKGIMPSCTFLPRVARRKPGASMQNRLKHLESLVKDAMAGQAPSVAPQNKSVYVPKTTNGRSSSNENGVSQIGKAATVPSLASTGQVLVGSTESTYVGATHWAAILEDIDEIKTYMDEEFEEQDEGQHLKSYTSLIFSAQSPSSKTDLLRTLPQRATVDILVSQYFNCNSPALHIIHKPTFQKNYQNFWADPEAMPIIFLGLLYSMLTVATMQALFAGHDSVESRKGAVELNKGYRECCIQCLLLSNYTKPGRYTLETLFIFMETEFLLSKDDQVHTFLLIGNLVKIALRMGLHRDSTKVGGIITPFQVENRRRLWHHLLQLDVLSSFHIGLPGSLQGIESDTLLPGNFRDEDFDEECVALPIPRPESEITPMTYTICKSRLCQQAGRIVALVNRLSPVEYDEVTNLDGDLRMAYQQVPRSFLVSSSGPSITDSSSTTIRQFSLATLYQKSLCMLHRKHFMKAQTNPEFAFSKRVGLEAAMELLNYQSMIPEAARPGGPLSRDRWFLSALSMHDFLLAAMMVYLSLIQGISYDHTTFRLNRVQEEEIKALERSRTVWNDDSFLISAEAKKASMILRIMLNKIHSKIGTDQLSIYEPGLSANGRRGDEFSRLTLQDSSVSQNGIDNISPSGSIGGSIFQTTPSSGQDGPLGFDLAPTEMESFGFMFDVPTDFDWEMFDNQLRPQDDITQTWPDMMEDYPTGNDSYYNI